MNTVLLHAASVLMKFLPPTRFFGLKRVLLRTAGASIKDGVKIVSSANILTAGALEIGARTWLGHQVLIVGGDALVKIGEHVDIAPRVTIVTGTHKIDLDGPRVAGQGRSEPISIDDGCWICASSTILGGSQIGKGSIVAAGAVVQGVFPERSFIAGIPARVICTVEELAVRRAADLEA